MGTSGYKALDAASLPTILAGPMVRRVDAGSVSIWLAMKESATVTVTVLKEDGTTRVLTGSSQTLQIGTSLHLCTVTVRGAGLEPGCRYLYRVTTQTKDFKTLLGSDAALTALCYSPNTLPSFYVPPATADGLRIAHGGHRKPHGLGKDALAALDSVIEDCYKTSPPTPAQTHPHQLFFTGNQIYGDEVADALLLLIQDAARALGCTGATVEAGKRADYLQDTMGFPIDRRDKSKVRNHLLTFHEYVLMHLFVWSDVLWPKPSATQDGTPICKLEDYPPAQGLSAGRYASEVKALELFRQTLTAVRRLLANVPTYMIFDEHDLVYRCYADRQWCEDVLPDDPGDGLEKLEKRKRLLKDAFKAYALCQGWGNDPEQFAFLAQPNPLEALDTRIYLPTLKHPRTGAPSEESWMKWHYSMCRSSINTIALDSLTWRVFGEGHTDTPELIGQNGLNLQLNHIAIMSSTSRLPDLPFPVTLAIISNPVLPHLGRPNEDQPAQWSLMEKSFDILLTSLSHLGKERKEVLDTATASVVNGAISRLYILSAAIQGPYRVSCTFMEQDINADSRPMISSALIEQISSGALTVQGRQSYLTGIDLGTSRQLYIWEQSPLLALEAVQLEWRVPDGTAYGYVFERQHTSNAPIDPTQCWAIMSSADILPNRIFTIFDCSETSAVRSKMDPITVREYLPGNFLHTSACVHKLQQNGLMVSMAMSY